MDTKAAREILLDGTSSKHNESKLNFYMNMDALLNNLLFY